MRWWWPAHLLQEVLRFSLKVDGEKSKAETMLKLSCLLSFLLLHITKAVRIAIVAPSTVSPFGGPSPVDIPPTYKEVARQLSKKVKNQFKDSCVLEDTDADVVVGIGCVPKSRGRVATVTYPPAPDIEHCNGFSYKEGEMGMGVPWSERATGKRLLDYAHKLLSRHTTDDAATSILLIVNQLVETVPWVEHSIDPSWEKGVVQNVQEFGSMVTKCGNCIARCLADPECKACIDALNKIDTRDQVESYRCITSYESQLLSDFSFCILQKNNVFGCKADVPELPIVSPMNEFRAMPLTTEVANQILIGSLEDVDSLKGLQRQHTETSWRVACGANAAYDAFGVQLQLFYYDTKPDGGKGQGMWYDPIFLVETLDGRKVWAKRHYKVKPDPKLPGRYTFSVLDNGVTSLERWTILDAADDLTWAVLHYSGAASAVGLSYTGGLLCTFDGKLPPGDIMKERIEPAFLKADICMWELFQCNNDISYEVPPPLGHFRDNVSRKRIKL